MTFHGREATEAHRRNVHESPRSMTWVLWFLAGGAVAMGALGLPMLWTGSEPLFEQLLAPSMAIGERSCSVRAAVHGHPLEWGLMAVQRARWR